jgi:hypothetical protein
MLPSSVPNHKLATDNNLTTHGGTCFLHLSQTIN